MARARACVFCIFVRGVGQDLSEAYRWFKEASERDTVSAAMAADMLMRGAGVQADHKAAAALFKMSIVRVCCAPVCGECFCLCG